MGYQQWRHLTFLHWRVPPEQVRSKLPRGMELDTFDGSAWIGLVPFLMDGVRPRWAPAVPGVSRFPETNVRTYVTRVNGEGEWEPGVYFFSLDAAKWPAVLIARTVWSLPYFRATMSVDRDGDRALYRSRRLWPGPRGAGGRIEVTAAGPPAPALPGTLDHFLAERYLLFTSARGAILRGQVHHTPYPLRSAQADQLDDSLVAAAGFAGLSGSEETTGRPPDHVCFSEGVDVEIFQLRRG
ncbi:hypothetical protein LzC2_11900 [Planctomycetes bacterium LzC2]|uniref:DUF2071 domain-containing protein n=1 Tax=Alienimonas chondri TaxID=2681879 RepID=A0ABX1VD18_9PLAN|nr:hypothetical protein [Alienimonas chondri]